MRALWPIIAIVGCAKPAPPTHAELEPPTITPLEVIVLADYATRETCADVAPRRLEVMLDGRVVGTIDIPCATTVQAPPPQFAAPVFEVPPGKHTIHVRELGTGIEADRELDFPTLDPLLATKLLVWATEDELDIQGLRATMTVL